MLTALGKAIYVSWLRWVVAFAPPCDRVSSLLRA